MSNSNEFDDLQFSTVVEDGADDSLPAWPTHTADLRADTESTALSDSTTLSKSTILSNSERSLTFWGVTAFTTVAGVIILSAVIFTSLTSTESGQPSDSAAGPTTSIGSILGDDDEATVSPATASTAVGDGDTGSGSQTAPSSRSTQTTERSTTSASADEPSVTSPDATSPDATSPGEETTTEATATTDGPTTATPVTDVSATGVPPTTAPVAPTTTANPTTAAPTTVAPTTVAPTAPDTTRPATLATLRRRVLRRTNYARRLNDCPVLVEEPRLNSVAQAYSTDMVERRFFGYVDPNGRTLASRVRARYPAIDVGSNIARGHSTSGAVFNEWFADPQRRAQIEDCSYTETGLGYAEADGDEAGGYWTQIFARR